MVNYIKNNKAGILSKAFIGAMFLATALITVFSNGVTPAGLLV
jgi:hypothetical protein